VGLAGTFNRRVSGVATTSRFAHERGAREMQGRAVALARRRKRIGRHRIEVFTMMSPRLLYGMKVVGPSISGARAEKPSDRRAPCQTSPSPRLPFALYAHHDSNGSCESLYLATQLKARHSVAALRFPMFQATNRIYLGTSRRVQSAMRQARIQHLDWMSLTLTTWLLIADSDYVIG
jgi:hypothetical protein